MTDSVTSRPGLETRTAAPSAAACAGVAAGRCAHCLVRSRAFCAAFAPQELRALESAIEDVAVAPGQPLFFEHDDAAHVFNVFAGTVMTYKILEDGRRQILDFLEPGDIVGFAAGGTYGYSAEAITEATLCRIARRRVRELSARFPALETRLLEIVVQALEASQMRLVALGRKTAVERLAGFLTQLAAKREDWGLAPNPIVLPMGRQEIADHLGLTPETVSRALTQLTRQGTIAVPKPQIVDVLKPERLGALAEGR